MSEFAWTDPAFGPIARMVAERTGLLFRDMQRDSVEMGIRRGMKDANLFDLRSYQQHLLRHIAAFDDLVAELTIGETYFFRDSKQFELIRAEVIPEVRRRRGLNHLLRAWSAACASGEEAYSLAMLFHTEGLGSQWHVLGTDVSRRSLKRAREAQYSEWSLRGEGAEQARPHLRQTGSQYEVAAHLRSRVAFEYLNLALDAYPSTVTGTRDLDLILCRNVLIYFDRDTIHDVAKRLYESLSIDGWLITAAGDPILDEFAPWESQLTAAGLVYRRRAPGTLFAETTRSASRIAPTRSIEPINTPPRFGDWPVPEDSSKSLATGATADSVSVPVAATPSRDWLAEAEAALQAGDYQRAADLAAKCEASEAARAIQVQALANVDPVIAEAACSAALKEHGLSPRLHYLRSVLLAELDRESEAVEAARRAIYLDPNLVIVHYLLGTILRRADDWAGAARAFRAVRDLCWSLPAEEIVPFSDGEQAGALARSAEQQLRSLER